MPTERKPSLDADDEFVLRPGTTSDLPQLHEVFVAASAMPGQPQDRRSPEAVRAWVDSLLDRPGELWLAERGDLVLGFLLLRGDWLSLLFVRPDRPARGVGAAMMELVQALRPGGFGLRVHEANKRARDFYRRHGLIELERTDGTTYDDGTPDLQMAWPGQDPLEYLRGRIDAVDDELAVLLARRAALTAAVQDHKVASGSEAGQEGRDSEREEEIVRRMSQHVPGLPPELIARVVHTLIAESLAAWERRDGR
jgi:chorismate mutase/GNAT superfamily N-acetyltransferase